MIVPRLGDEHDRIGLGCEKSGKSRIIGGRTPHTLHHAEGGEPRLLRPLDGEEFGVEGIGPRIAALDVIDAELIEPSCDIELVVERKIDAGRLRTITQRRVEESETFAGHSGLPSQRKSSVMAKNRSITPTSDATSSGRTILHHNRQCRGSEKNDGRLGLILAESPLAHEV